MTTINDYYTPDWPIALAIFGALCVALAIVFIVKNIKNTKARNILISERRLSLLTFLLATMLVIFSFGLALNYSNETRAEENKNKLIESYGFKDFGTASEIFPWPEENIIPVGSHGEAYMNLNNQPTLVRLSVNEESFYLEEVLSDGSTKALDKIETQE